uniref:Ground-like domain-containing protein n=1 Tax=Strongyloides papillosus TaxID=174720 RepID=A0A0N5CDH8_STREA
MLYYIILFFPLTSYAFFFQNSPCSCVQQNCPISPPCPESTVQNSVITPPSGNLYQLQYNTSPCFETNTDNNYGSNLPVYQEPLLITSSYSPINTYEYKEIPQSQPIYVSPGQMNGNDIDSYQSQKGYNIQDMTATVDNNYDNILQQEQRDSLSKGKVFTEKTSMDTVNKKKKAIHKQKTQFKSLCNNSKLARIMAESIVSDISISKLLISDAIAIAYKNTKANVICASGDFSYSILVQKEYCEATKGNVTCFAYL